MRNKVFAATLVVALMTGALAGVARAAFTSSGDIQYYATNSLNMYCARYYNELWTDVTGTSTSPFLTTKTIARAKKTLYCPDEAPAPNGYIRARNVLYNLNYDICWDAGWVWNASATAEATSEGAFLYVPGLTPNCREGQDFRNHGWTEIALDFAWRNYDQWEGPLRQNN